MTPREKMFDFLLSAVLGEGGDGWGLVVCKYEDHRIVGKQFFEWLDTRIVHNPYSIYANDEKGLLISDGSNENFYFTNAEEVATGLNRDYYEVIIQY